MVTRIADTLIRPRSGRIPSWQRTIWTLRAIQALHAKQVSEFTANMVRDEVDPRHHSSPYKTALDVLVNHGVLAYCDAERSRSILYRVLDHVRVGTLVDDWTEGSKYAVQRLTETTSTAPPPVKGATPLVQGWWDRLLPRLFGRRYEVRLLEQIDRNLARLVDMWED